MDYKAELIRLKQYLQTEIQFITDEDSVPDKFARQANKNTLEKVEQILKRGEEEPTNESSGLHLQRVNGCAYRDELLEKTKTMQEFTKKHYKEKAALPLHGVNGSLAYQKAVEYAKFKHQDEYYDKAYARDVEETIYDFQSGFATAMKIANDR